MYLNEKRAELFMYKKNVQSVVQFLLTIETH